jgi:predicted phage replisome organizer
MSNKYFWLKLTTDFFNREEIKLVKKIENGAEYVNFYLQLLLKSLNHEGKLMFREVVPYTVEMLATVNDVSLEVATEAIEVFTNLHLIKILPGGILFMVEAQSMVGTETQWAERKRKYRKGKEIQAKSIEKKHAKDNNETLSGQCPSNVQGMSSLDIKKQVTDWFHKDFWPLYPLKKDPAKTLERILKLKPDEKLRSKIINALNLQITEHNFKEKHGVWCPEWKYPSTWINKKSWQDEVIINESEIKSKPKSRSQSLATRLQENRRKEEYIENGETS